MPKRLFFGIWEFIFTLIFVILFIKFIWPAIENYIDLQNQTEYDKAVNEILNAAEKHVQNNIINYAEENITYKITLNELAVSKDIKLPIKNPVTNNNLDPKLVYVSVYLNNGIYEYNLIVNSKYKDAKYLNKQKLKIGDYVNYPINYQNNNFNQISLETGELSGWRIISLNDNEIKIISAGIPNGYEALTNSGMYDIFNNLENYKCESKKIANILEPCLGNFLDLHYVRNEISILVIDDLTSIPIASNLRTTGTPYWVLGKDSKEIKYIDMDGNIKPYAILTAGIRPVLTLRSDVKTTGKIKDEWHLIVKE